MPILKAQLSEVEVKGIMIGQKSYWQIPLILKNTWIETTTEKATSSDVESQISNLNYGDYITDFKKLNDEKIDDKKCYHFQFKLDFDKLLSSSLFKDIPTQELQSAKASLKDSENLIDIYVGKRDLVLHKDKIHFQMTKPIKIEFNSEDTLSNFGNAVNIQAPQNAKQLDKITPADLAASPIGQIFLGSLLILK
jgi:hypothetical protein